MQKRYQAGVTWFRRRIRSAVSRARAVGWATEGGEGREGGEGGEEGRRGWWREERGSENQCRQSGPYIARSLRRGGEGGRGWVREGG